LAVKVELSNHRWERGGGRVTFLGAKDHNSHKWNDPGKIGNHTTDFGKEREEKK